MKPSPRPEQQSSQRDPHLRPVPLSRDPTEAGLPVTENNLTNELTSIQDVEGETDERVRALLLLARAFYGQDDADSYAGVFTQPLTISEPVEAEIDGLVTSAVGSELQGVLLVWVGREGRAATISSALGLHEATRQQASELEQQLARHRQTRPIIADLRPLRRNAESFEWRVVVVSATAWSPAEQRNLDLVDHLDRWDGPRLDELVAARLEPGWLDASTTVKAAERERLETRAGARRVIVAPVPGAVIAEWPGIDSRRLFDLNVRFGLGAANRVRQSLDAALEEDDQDAFIASHNGLTVVCENISLGPTDFQVTNFSVVNGAQSVIALHENRARISPELRLLVKFVELGRDDALASEIAIRSNTQNPVTGRNLRALDESQVRLRQELAHRGYIFETRPDSRRRSGDREIKNDAAAQWICTVYLERPWLAVKRTLLFAPETFQEIYPSTRSAEQIILLYTIRRLLDQARTEFPEELRRAWLLTALTAMYLIGQAMRFDESQRRLLLSPNPGEGDSDSTVAELESLVTMVREYMSTRHGRLVETDGYDNFRVDFKRQRTLLEMSADFIRTAHTAARKAV